MSTYFETVALVVGASADVHALLDKILAAEHERPTRTISFDFLPSSQETEILHVRSAVSQYRPTAQAVLQRRDPKIDALDVAVYLECIQESQDVYVIAYHRGQLLGESSKKVTPEKVAQEFERRIVAYGVDRATWEACVLPDLRGRWVRYKKRRRMPARE